MFPEHEDELIQPLVHQHLGRGRTFYNERLVPSLDVGINGSKLAVFAEGRYRFD
jgi:hypothetical protein